VICYDFRLSENQPPSRLRGGKGGAAGGGLVARLLGGVRSGFVSRDLSNTSTRARDAGTRETPEHARRRTWDM
jgi:hypothetical protein